jgi:prophage regulatory protein
MDTNGAKYMQNFKKGGLIDATLVGQSIPAEGFIRLSAILAPTGPIPVSKSTWWAGVKSGRFPKPVKLGPRTTAWNVKDIRTLIDKME